MSKIFHPSPLFQKSAGDFQNKAHDFQISGNRFEISGNISTISGSASANSQNCFLISQERFPNSGNDFEISENDFKNSGNGSGYGETSSWLLEFVPVIQETISRHLKMASRILEMISGGQEMSPMFLKMRFFSQSETRKNNLSLFYIVSA